MHAPDLTLPQLLEQSAARWPEALALIYFERKIPYAELLDEVNRAAAGFQALGVQPGDRVALMMPNCPQFVVAFFGALRAGAVVTATCPIYTQREAAHQWNDAGARVVVASNKLRALVEVVKAECPSIQHFVFTSDDDPVVDGHPTWRNLLATSAPPTPVAAEPGDLACLQYTGGTTGASKGAMLTHRNLVTNAAQTCDRVTIGSPSPDIVLGVLPFFHIFAITSVLVSSVMTGSAIVILPRFELEPALAALRAHRPTVFSGVPTMFIALLGHPAVCADDFRSLRVCTSGGGPMPVEVQKKFQLLLAHGRMVEGYGLSETSPVTHLNPIAGEIRLGSIGPVLRDTEARIVDVETGLRELPDGEVGEIVVRGPQVMRGYWNKPEDTARAIRDGWFHTGDIGLRDGDGYFFIVDRKKDLILAGGFNVYPREVEEELFKHPRIQEAVVIGVPDAYRGETVKAFVVPRPGEVLTSEEVIAHCRERLAGYKVPRLVEFRAALPKSGVGKYLRRELRREETDARARV